MYRVIHHSTITLRSSLALRLRNHHHHRLDQREVQPTRWFSAKNSSRSFPKDNPLDLTREELERAKLELEAQRAELLKKKAELEKNMKLFQGKRKWTNLSEETRNTWILLLVALLIFCILRALRWYGEKKDMELTAEHERHLIREQMQTMINEIDEEDVEAQVDQILARVKQFTPINIKDEKIYAKFRSEIADVIKYERAPPVSVETIVAKSSS